MNMQTRKKQWKCKCGAILGVTLDNNRMEILGTHAQKYEIGFNYIKIDCYKCGTPNAIGSWVREEIDNLQNYSRVIPEYTNTISQRDVSPLPKGKFYLPQFLKKILLINLSQKQKDIYKLLEEGSNYSIDDIAMKVHMAPKKTSEHIEHISRLIGNIRSVDWAEEAKRP